MPLLRVIVICFLLRFVASADIFNPSLSNGTCWYSKNEQADDIYIPCGNAALGDQTCCQARDICLSSRACYNLGYGVTYLAGCTDSTYTNSSVCPPKGRHNDQQWVGLVRCFVSNDTYEQDEEWAGCLDSNQPTVTFGQSCTCDTSSHTAAFTDSPDLTDIASLPVTVSNIIAWFSGFTPATPTETSTTESSASSSSSETSTSSSPLSQPSSPNTVSSTTSNQSSPTTFAGPSISTAAPTTLSTASKAAIGVGTAAGVLGLGALTMWIAIRYRKKKSQSQQSSAMTEQSKPDSNSTTHNIYTDRDETSDQAIKSPAWSGHKPELPANNESTISNTERLPPSTNNQGSSRNHLSVSTATPTYRAYSPYMSQVSEIGGSSALDLNHQRCSLGRLAQDKVYEMPG